MRAPRRAIKGYQGEGLITDSIYYLPLLDADGNIQVICAHGVDEIATVTRTRLPHVAREIFPIIRASMPWMETGAGPVELLIGVDNRQWLPAHIEDSWDPDDDMRLMKSAFGHWLMITDGWGRSLIPPEEPQGDKGMRQGMKLRIQEKSKKSGWRSTGAGVKAHGPVTRKEHGRPRRTKIGVLTPKVEVEQPSGDRHPRERNPSLGADGEGSMGLNGARGSVPPHLGCHTAPLGLRVDRVVADRAGERPAGPSYHEGSAFPTPEGYLDCYSHRTRRPSAAASTHDGRHGAGHASGAQLPGQRGPWGAMERRNVGTENMPADHARGRSEGLNSGGAAGSKALEEAAGHALSSNSVCPYNHVWTGRPDGPSRVQEIPAALRNTAYCLLGSAGERQAEGG